MITFSGGREKKNQLFLEGKNKKILCTNKMKISSMSEPIFLYTWTIKSLNLLNIKPRSLKFDVLGN